MSAATHNISGNPKCISFTELPSFSRESDSKVLHSMLHRMAVQFIGSDSVIQVPGGADVLQ